jgi:hypothetical protein
VPGIVADLVSSFGSGLNNSGAVLILKDSNGNQVDRTDALSGWPAGDNDTKDTMQKNGAGWITAAGTPKSVNAQNGSQVTPQPLPSSEVSSLPDSGWPEYIPPEDRPSVSVYAGKDFTGVVGAESEYRGVALGPDKKPLEKARFVWNFGNGEIKEGQNIFYCHKYPGEYNVVLSVVWDGQSFSDSLVVKIVASEVKISEIKTGAGSFIELQNSSRYEINISRWILRAGTDVFIFPSESRMRPGSYLAVSSDATKLEPVLTGGSIELFYPGSFLADKMAYLGVLPPGKSYSRTEGEGSVISGETPGAENKLPENFKNESLPKETEAIAVAIASARDTLKKEENTIAAVLPVLAGELPEKEIISENESSGNNEAVVLNFPGNSGFKIFGNKIYLAVAGLLFFVIAGIAVFLRKKSQIAS